MIRIILITGANRGLGRELASQLAQEGNTILLGARDMDAAIKAASEINGNVDPILLDVTDIESIDTAANQILTAYGRLDVLVNNVGGMFDVEQAASTVDLDLVQQAMEINFFSTWRVTQTMLPLLRKSKVARIINVSSQKGSLELMSAGIPAYSTSKAALNALTRNLAAELLPEGITVNAVCPGWTATDLGGEQGRPISDGADSIRFVVNLPENTGTGKFYQDGKIFPW